MMFTLLCIDTLNRTVFYCEPQHEFPVTTPATMVLKQPLQQRPAQTRLSLVFGSAPQILGVVRFRQVNSRLKRLVGFGM